MERPIIWERLTEVFRDVVDEDISISPTTTAQDVPEWDSITHIRLVLSVERAFKTRFSAAEVARLKNVGEFVDLIASRV